MKIQSPTLFPWQSTQQARHVHSHFRVKTKLIWKRKYNRGAELATSGNSGKCNWVRIISLIPSDQINNNARWDTTITTNGYQVTEKLIGVQTCWKKQNTFLLRVSKQGWGVGMSREGRRVWLAAWGGENYELNLHIFKCEKSEQRGLLQKGESTDALDSAKCSFSCFPGAKQGRGPFVRCANQREVNQTPQRWVRDYFCFHNTRFYTGSAKIFSTTILDVPLGERWWGALFQRGPAGHNF